MMRMLVSIIFLVLECHDYHFLLYLSVSARGVICQFCGPYFTVQPAKLQPASFLACLINLRDTINILLLNLVSLVPTVSYRSSFFPVESWPARFALGP